MNYSSIVTCRRSLLARIAAGSVVLLGGHAVAETRPGITVWKDRNCDCCVGWVEHLRRNGFVATIIETSDIQMIKNQQGVPAALASCHTADIAGYVIEGHVPAHAVLRLLTEKPAARGLAVPGMPIGSPGMEGGRPEIYDVMLFGKGAPSRFGRYLGMSPV